MSDIFVNPAPFEWNPIPVAGAKGRLLMTMSLSAIFNLMESRSKKES